jgi:hypothetical protein
MKEETTKEIGKSLIQLGNVAVGTTIFQQATADYYNVGVAAVGVICLKRIAHKKSRLAAFVFTESPVDADNNGVKKKACSRSVRCPHIFPKTAPVRRHRSIENNDSYLSF